MATTSTATGKALESYIQDTLSRAKAGATAAQTAGYPAESDLTKAYYSGVPSLYMYGDADQAQALDRTADLYNAYGAAGNYNKTDFSDIGRLYGQAGAYDPAQFGYANYTAGNIQNFMNPYEELVSKRAKQRLNDAFEEGRGNREMEAIRNDAFGGSGMAIREAMANRDYMQQLADMDAQNLSNAFESGAGLYGKQYADYLAAAGANEASRQFANQAQFAGLEGLMAARNAQAAQEAAAKEAQFTALQGQGTSAQQQAAMAEQQKNMELSNLAALQAAGAQQQDQALAKSQYPLALAGMEASVLSPITGGTSDVQTSTQKTSTLQNILGGLTAGAGIVSGLGGISGIKSLFGAAGGLVPDGLERRYQGGGLAELEPEYYSYGR